LGAFSPSEQFYPLSKLSLYTWLQLLAIIYYLDVSNIDCVIEALANPERERLKTDDTNISFWLQCKCCMCWFTLTHYVIWKESYRHIFRKMWNCWQWSCTVDDCTIHFSGFPRQPRNQGWPWNGLEV